MKLPNGYERLSKNTESFRGQLGMDIDQALSLIKEMAEALEEYEKATPIRPYEDKVLKKFKEWE